MVSAASVGHTQVVDSGTRQRRCVRREPCACVHVKDANRRFTGLRENRSIFHFYRFGRGRPGHAPRDAEEAEKLLGVHLNPIEGGWMDQELRMSACFEKECWSTEDYRHELLAKRTGKASWISERLYAQFQEPVKCECS